MCITTQTPLLEEEFAFLLVENKDCCSDLTSDADCQQLLWSSNPTFAGSGAYQSGGVAQATPRCKRTLNQMRMIYQPSRWLSQERFDSILTSSTAADFDEVDPSLCASLTEDNAALCSDYRAEKCFNAASSLVASTLTVLTAVCVLFFFDDGVGRYPLILSLLV